MCRNAILPAAVDAESLDSEVIWNGKIMDKAEDFVMGGTVLCSLGSHHNRLLWRVG